MFVQWQDEIHSLGIPEIDAQHQQLFYITNKLFEEGEKDPVERRLTPLFKQLYAYSRFHFSSEEGMMKKAGFPNYSEHKEIHGKFIFKIKEYLENYRRFPKQNIAEPTEFLVNWIITHTAGDDKLYQQYFKEKGITPSIYFSPAQEGSKSVFQEAQALWEKNQLALNIKEIDDQHKELVLILQQVNDLQRADPQRRWAYIPSIIEKLYFYVKYHFSYEEELMSRYNYPETLAHRDLHQNFILKIEDFAREYKLKKESLSDEMLDFLKKWVVEHILKEDEKYKNTLIKDK